MTEWSTTLNFEDGATFETNFADVETFDTTMDEVVKVTTSDHRELTHRDADNQHPISAIQYLQNTLEITPNQAISNQEIQNILNL